jgi:hypothetical protein
VSLYLIKRFFSANNLQFRSKMMLSHALMFAINYAFIIWLAVVWLQVFVILKNGNIVANQADLL